MRLFIYYFFLEAHLLPFGLPRALCPYPRVTHSGNLRLPPAVGIAGGRQCCSAPFSSIPTVFLLETVSLLLDAQFPRLPWPQLLVPQVPFCCFQGLGSPGRPHTLWAGCLEVLPAVSVGHSLQGSRILVLGQTLVDILFWPVSPLFDSSKSN